MILSRISSFVLVCLFSNFNYAMENNTSCNETALICKHRAAFKNPDFFEIKWAGAINYSSTHYATISKKRLADKFVSMSISLQDDEYVSVSDLNSEQMIAMRDMFINPSEYIITKEEYIKKFDDNFYKQRLGRSFRGSLESFAYKSYTKTINDMIQRITNFVNQGLIVIPLKVNDLVVEIGEEPYTSNKPVKIEKVISLIKNFDISNDWANLIGLEDGMYHHRSLLRLLISSAQGISTGDKVLINSTRTFSKVTRITEDFRFLLANGRFYRRDQIARINE